MVFWWAAFLLYLGPWCWKRTKFYDFHSHPLLHRLSLKRTLHTYQRKFRKPSQISWNLCALPLSHMRLQLLWKLLVGLLSAGCELTLLAQPQVKSTAEKSPKTAREQQPGLAAQAARLHKQLQQLQKILRALHRLVLHRRRCFCLFSFYLDSVNDKVTLLTNWH